MGEDSDLVVIVGGGIAGASLGAEIAGARPTLIVEMEDRCGFHSTGRSAAFWLESYGGRAVAPLTAASRAFLDSPPETFAEAGFLRPRGAIHLSSEGPVRLIPGVAARTLSTDELNALVPGLRPGWTHATLEPGCADIDVAALHEAYLRAFRRKGGKVMTGVSLERGRRADGGWTVALSDGTVLRPSTLVNAAGAWADEVATRCGVQPIGIVPKRRTMVQLRVAKTGLRDLPLVSDSKGSFYFKGEGDRTIWLSPHDEIDCAPCDAAPEEMDVAVAIDRFGAVVDWPIEAVERRWAGLRSFAPDRVPVYGYDPASPGFFWCAGQGGFGIQTAPAAAGLAAARLLGIEQPDGLAHIAADRFSPERFR